MATCSITGTLVDPTGTAISGATVELRIVTSQFDMSNSLVVPYVSTVTTDTSGNFTIVADRGISAIITIDYPPNATDTSRRYSYSVTVPNLSTTTLSSLVLEF